MRVFIIIFLALLTDGGLTFYSKANAKNIRDEECEEVWSKGDILHEYDLFAFEGKDRIIYTFIRYDGAMYHGVITWDYTEDDGDAERVFLSCVNTEG